MSNSTVELDLLGLNDFQYQKFGFRFVEDKIRKHDQIYILE